MTFEFNFGSPDIHVETVPILCHPDGRHEAYKCRHCGAWLDTGHCHYFCPVCGQAFAYWESWFHYWKPEDEETLDIMAGCINAGYRAGSIGQIGHRDSRTEKKMRPARPRILKAIAKGRHDILSCPSCAREFPNPMVYHYQDFSNHIEAQNPIHYCSGCGQALDDNEGKTWKYQNS